MAELPVESFPVPRNRLEKALQLQLQLDTSSVHTAKTPTKPGHIKKPRPSPLPTADRETIAERLYAPLSPLASWETRVLALHQGERGETLTADLHKAVITHHDGLGLVSEDRNAEYEALSYTWGSQNFNHVLVCNGVALSITSNLHEALQRLRRKNVTRFVWVDAICINQFDNDERARQIRNLFVIFKRARRVLVWLGRASRHTKQALQFATVVTRAAYRPDSSVARHNWWHEADARTEAKKTLKMYNQSTVLGILHGLQDLAQRAWMRRAWVIQEIHAASSIRVRCGPHSVQWKVWTQIHNTLQTVIWFIEMERQRLQSPVSGYFTLPSRSKQPAARIGFINSMHRALQSGSEADSAGSSDVHDSDDDVDVMSAVQELWERRYEEIDATRNVMEFLMSYGPGPDKASSQQIAHRVLSAANNKSRQHESMEAARELNTVLLQSSHLQAIDDRDRIFALLGLTHVSISYGLEHDMGSTGININYDKTTSDVYQNVTKFFMQKCQHLGPMYYKWATNTDDTSTEDEPLHLPSWTPDWRNIDHKRYLAVMVRPLDHPWDLMSGESLDHHLNCLWDRPKFHYDKAMRRSMPHWPGTYFVETPDFETSGVLKVKGRAIGTISEVATDDHNAGDAVGGINIKLHHSGFMNYCVMSRKAQHALPSYGPRPDSPFANAAPIPVSSNRERQKPVGRFSSWLASSVPAEHDVLACVFGGSLPLILRRKASDSSAYECIGYASPSQTFAGESLLEMVTTSLLTSPSQVMDNFDIY